MFVISYEHKSSSGSSWGVWKENQYEYISYRNIANIENEKYRVNIDIEGFQIKNGDKLDRKIIIQNTNVRQMVVVVLVTL